MHFTPKSFSTELLPFVCAALLASAQVHAELPDIARPSGVGVPLGQPAELHVGFSSMLQAQWRKDGVAIAGATTDTLSFPRLQLSDVGLYTIAVSNPSGTTETLPAIVGVTIETKLAGDGMEVGRDIRHPNGNVFDQVLMTGPVVAVTADPGQVTRVSFVDLDDDIVQVEFSGAGTLVITLENFTPAAPPAKYHQPGISYVKGHASLVLTGTDGSTHLSVFSVGRLTAVNQALFPAGEVYDGVADLGVIAVVPTSGGVIGSIRAANAALFRTRSVTGLYAPEVVIIGEVYLGDVTAADAATPTLCMEGSREVRITGGDTWQANGRAIVVKGVNALVHVDGTTSAGELLPAQASQARLNEGDEDVTERLLNALPVPISMRPPAYPFELRRAGVTGEALVEFIVDTNGLVRDAFVVRATHAEFGTASVNAIMQWTFTPGRRAGRFVNVRMQQPISFSLSP